MEKINEMIEVDTYYWTVFEENKLKEERMIKLFISWVNKELPPIKFKIMPCDGYRVFMYPCAEATDEDKHKLLSWIVRMSNKKFERNISHSDNRLLFWNSGNEMFNDENGELRTLILFENPSLGKCKWIEVEKTVKVKELVCE